MKRNDFVTNVLKCNNFHCLASLRLAYLNLYCVRAASASECLASLRLAYLNLRYDPEDLTEVRGLASSEASVSK